VKTLPAMLFAAVPPLASGAALAQGGGMMDSGMWGGGWMGGYGGAWVPILLVAVVVGLVVWVVKRK
jgi:hypothetical protein